MTGTKIDAGAVHTSDLAHGAVTSSRVKNDSLSLSDLVGTDITGAISFTLNGGTCALLILGAPGAEAGQVGLVSTTGGDWPTAVSVGAVRTGAGSVSISACNNAGSTVTVTDLGVRVVTFG